MSSESNIPDTLYDKLNKIYRLSVYGMPGERDNAKKILSGLLKKYAISIEDIQNEEVKEYRFSYRNKHELTLFKQIVFKVFNKPTINYGLTPKHIFVECTKVQFIEIEEMYRLYKLALKKEIRKVLKDLTEAFIHKHRLFPDIDIKTNKNPQPIDLDHLRRLLVLMAGCENVKRPRKAIEYNG